MKKITLLAAFLVASLSVNAQLLTEGFDDITLLPGIGFSFVNASDSPSLDWFQGNDTVFPAYEGAPTSYIGVNYNSTAGTEISNWMILPALELTNGDEIVFWTRTTTASTFPDRLEVRISPDGSNVDPSGPTDVGSYTELLLEINPTLTVGGYPEVWTQYTVSVAGLTGAVTTRIAFRYFVTNGGPTGTNSNYIGVDSLVVSDVLSVADQTFNGFNYFVDADNRLNLSANTPMESVKLFNILGQQVVAQKLNNTDASINISSLKTGVYIATVAIDGVSKSFKIVKN